MTYIQHGNEFRVNAQTEGHQELPTIAALANGGFVATWQDRSGTLGDSSATSIKARLYDRAGVTLGTEFLVNTQAADRQLAPRIDGLDDGGFVVAWQDTSALGDGNSSSIKAQIFTAGGVRVGTEFLVNTSQR